MYVKPVEGRLVRDPVSNLEVPPEGREVPDTEPFWVRKVKSGDVVVSSPPVVLQISDSVSTDEADEAEEPAL